MGFLIFVVYVVGLFVVASIARNTGRSYGGFFVLSLLLTPVIGGLILFLLVKAKNGKINKEIARLTELAEKGGAEDQYQLGMFLLYSNKPEEAMPWLQKATDQGHPRAKNFLTINVIAKTFNYRTGCARYSFPKEYATNDLSYPNEYMAKSGSAPYQYTLGLAYQNCYSLETEGNITTILVYDKDPDIEQAVYWYKKSAEQGNPLGQGKLGECYLYGKGVEKDEKLGYKLLLLVAEGDSSSARDTARQHIEQTSGMSYEQFVVKYAM
jgi:TPR repeat protein